MEPGRELRRRAAGAARRNPRQPRLPHSAARPACGWAPARSRARERGRGSSMSDHTKRHETEADRRGREQVEAGRRAGRGPPAPGGPGEGLERPTRPASDPDPTEWPDPYDKRPDPRDPATVDTPTDPADPEARRGGDAAPRDPTASDPHPPRSRDQARREDPPER